MRVTKYQPINLFLLHVIQVVDYRTLMAAVREWEHHHKVIFRAVRKRQDGR